MTSRLPEKRDPTRGRWAVKAYRPFVSSIRELISTGRSGDWAAQNALLDGAASKELKSTVPLARRRRMGAFFTGSGLAAGAFENLAAEPEAVFDPACGAGDLLLRAALRLPIQATSEATLKEWGKRLSGFDLVPEFVQACRLRLALLACQRTGSAVDPMLVERLLPGIQRGDGLKALRNGRLRGALFLNPPFGQIPAPTGQGWWINRISRAAIFLEAGVNALQPGAHIVAILPDVIRSGSGYSNLRAWLANHLDNVTVTVVGPFDSSTDVDVFILTGRKRAASAVAPPTPINWYQLDYIASLSGQSVGDLFDVHVGKVVEYRDDGSQQDRPFVTAGSLRPWSVMRRIRDHWGAGDQVTVPPFVAIRRTSSPGDRQRALAAVVAGSRPVAVENHLITARPFSGQLGDALALMNRLRSDQINATLQRRIRCRHLTIASIRELPWN